ncbi:hypothetical protein HYPSUDRAFT_205081 [Hypholoma sublateritium FD-334 SS-4]|uniref:Uncharacterized protein n=1 Tax=Hypholoma sublateritium (strain FD-334 SS-4) TaxID=945553 RepID=A0A0D2M6P5_HYPSF|nr:hypothetical protein HYPSUDRAFT_205081 [Hypholoma sublateritium FD-334 SS-4]
MLPPHPRSMHRRTTRLAPAPLGPLRRARLPPLHLSIPRPPVSTSTPPVLLSVSRPPPLPPAKPSVHPKLWYTLHGPPLPAQPRTPLLCIVRILATTSIVKTVTALCGVRQTQLLLPAATASRRSSSPFTVLRMCTPASSACQFSYILGYCFRPAPLALIARALTITLLSEQVHHINLARLWATHALRIDWEAPERSLPRSRPLFPSPCDSCLPAAGGAAAAVHGGAESRAEDARSMRRKTQAGSWSRSIVHPLATCGAARCPCCIMCWRWYDDGVTRRC